MSGEAAMTTLFAFGAVLATVLLIPCAMAIGGAVGFMVVSGLWR